MKLKALAALTLLNPITLAFAGVAPSEVIVTRHATETAGLVRVGEVAASARKVFGGQDTLRQRATTQLKEKAAALGATVVLIEVDSFSATPINNVSMTGVAYAPKEGVKTANQSTTVKPTPTVANGEVIVTRNPDDIKGRTRVGEVAATARKLFGDQAVLRQRATAKLKADAAKLGATYVLIETDNFEATPINNISMTGVAYK